MDQELKQKIRALKEELDQEGFILLGIFGSVARNEHHSQSDVDLLYEMTDAFYRRFKGWDIYPALDAIQARIEHKLGCSVDLANKKALNEIARKHILPELVDV